tara:strand:+ start:1080 stop:1514 length:435 start_codon:yes stop_codon:yes gene_type:complete
MTNTLSVIIVSLCIIAISHKLINEYLVDISKEKVFVINRDITPHNELDTYVNLENEESNVEHTEIKHLSKSDMKLALTEYLNSQLQQDSPIDVTIDNQYDIMYDRTKTETVKSPLQQNISVNGTEDWGTSLEPYMGGTSNYATF